MYLGDRTGFSYRDIVAYRLSHYYCWIATPFDINGPVRNGRGDPVREIDWGRLENCKYSNQHWFRWVYCMIEWYAHKKWSFLKENQEN